MIPCLSLLPKTKHEGSLIVSMQDRDHSAGSASFFASFITIRLPGWKGREYCASLFFPHTGCSYRRLVGHLVELEAWILIPEGKV